MVMDKLAKKNLLESWKKLTCSDQSSIIKHDILAFYS